jgi:hypothetical protein
VALVEFTERAERSLLEILGKTKRLDETLLVVEMDGGEAQLSVKTSGDLDRLQSDIDLVGPFRVALGGEEVSIFVREPESSIGGRYELDYYSCGGRSCFQIRERVRAD